MLRAQLWKDFCNRRGAQDPFHQRTWDARAQIIIAEDSEVSAEGREQKTQGQVQQGPTYGISSQPGPARPGRSESSMSVDHAPKSLVWKGNSNRISYGRKVSKIHSVSSIRRTETVGQDTSTPADHIPADDSDEDDGPSSLCTDSSDDEDNGPPPLCMDSDDNYSDHHLYAKTRTVRTTTSMQSISQSGRIQTIRGECRPSQLRTSTTTETHFHQDSRNIQCRLDGCNLERSQSGHRHQQ